MHKLHCVLQLPISLQEAWAFFSVPANVLKITPPELQFEVLSVGGQEKMYAGQFIINKLRPIWNVPIEWVTEITHVEEPVYFIDEQRVGPYAIWHHEHRFIEIPDGVEVIDTVHYKLRFGILGKAIHYFKVKRDLEEIFKYRKEKLESFFGIYPH